MRVFWWQAGVHVEPENDEEREALQVLVDSLDVFDSRLESNSGPISDTLKGADE